MSLASNQKGRERHFAEQYHTETAHVAAATVNELWLVPLANSGCTACSANQACGTGLLQKVLGRRRLELCVPNTLGAQTGDHVLVSIPQQGLLIAASLLYLFPLLMLFLFSLIFSAYQFAEMWQVVAAALGLLLGFVIARHLANRLQTKAVFELRLIEKETINIELQTL